MAEPDQWDRAKRSLMRRAAVEQVVSEDLSAPEGPCRCTVCGIVHSSRDRALSHVLNEHLDVAPSDVPRMIVAAPGEVETPGAEVTIRRSSGRGQPPAILAAHWHHLIEGLQASSLQFYDSLDAALSRREIPDATRERIDYREAGLLSAKREYLRVTRGAQAADVCAAPFGSGFFVSWWLGEARPSPVVPTILAVALLIAAVRFLGLFYGPAAFVAGFFVVGAVMSQGEAAWHPWALAVPGLGWLWEKFFRPVTLFRFDSMLMFKDALHASVLEVVDGLTEAKGLRRLTELERKPTLRDFYRR